MNLQLDTLVKIVDEDRRSMHGGSGIWTRNRWRSVTPPLEPCFNGLHVVSIRQAPIWLGPRIGVVEVDGERIDQDDKTIVERARVIEWLDTWNERAARLFAADCAESAWPIWERYYPDDDRPRKAIEAARAFARGESVDLSAARSAAWSAAWSAAESAARSAAWSAAESAARSAAWSAAWSAAESAARSAAWSAAESAAWSAAWSAHGERLLAYLRGEA